jgi:hypothetical protein
MDKELSWWWSALAVSGCLFPRALNLCLHRILLLQNSFLSSAVTVLPKVHLGSYFGGLSHGHIEATQGMSASRQHSSCSGWWICHGILRLVTTHESSDTENYCLAKYICSWWCCIWRDLTPCRPCCPPRAPIMLSRIIAVTLIEWYAKATMCWFLYYDRHVSLPS